MNEAFLLALADSLRRVLRPLERSFGSAQDFSDFLLRYGWSVPPGSFNLGNVQGAIGISGDLTSAGQIAAQIGTGAGTPLQRYFDFLKALQEAIAKLRAPSGAAPGGLPQGAWDTLSAELLEGLIADYLEAFHPRMLGFLLLAGVVEEEDVPALGSANRVDYTRRRIVWDRIPQALSQPRELAVELYGWDDSPNPFKAAVLLERMQRSLELFGLDAELRTPPAPRLDAYYGQGNPHRGSAQELAVRLMRGEADSGASFEAQLWLLPMPPLSQPDAEPTGLAMGPLISAQGAVPVVLPWPFSVELEGALESNDGVRLELGPDGANAVLAVGGEVDARAAVGQLFTAPLVVVGTRLSHRLQLYGWKLSLAGRGAIADPEITVGVELDRAQLVIDNAEADGFIGRLFGTEPQTLEFSGGVAWSNKRGLSFQGQAALELVIPINKTILLVELRTLTVGVSIGTDGRVGAFGALAASAQLGPIAASVQGIGARAALVSRDPSDPPGVLGDLDLEFGFKPPDGVGLAIDAAVIKGGGYLYFDFDKGEYAGVLELSIKDQIQVKAIGLLSTKLPGGQSGFSLLLIITAQFPPIQLSFGFVLTGVGGMIGVNRTMVTDVLRAGIRSRTLDSILFPENPVPNAPKIISDLKAVFPPAESRFVFGPMVEIGWGTPVLVRGRLGVILELPEPVRLVILGQLKLALPRPEAPVVNVNLDAIGVVEFERQSLSLDAALYDSQVAGFELLGDMAARLTWAQRPNFALSVGGLNPRFQPPPGFPELRRLTLSMGQGNNPHLALEAYMALTSNSVQFGAHLELRAEGGGFVLHGHLGFDCLVILSPFSFIADMQAGIEVLRGGRSLMSVHLDLTLEGPTPWHAFGEASFKVLFLKITVGFDVRWGDETQVTLPQADARDPLLKALADTRNWSASLPPESERGATLGSGLTPQGAVLVHPFGRLAVRQTVVPLKTRISRFSNAPPADANEFQLNGATINQAAVTLEDARDHFARGQFLEMSDEERLTGDSYELMTSGASLGAAAGLKRGHRSQLDLDYETQLVENPVLPSESVDGTYRPAGDTFAALLAQGAAALSPVQTSGEAKYVEPGTESGIKNLDAQYVIASTEDLAVRADLGDASGAGCSAADHALERHLADHPEDRGILQVVAAHEAVAA